MSPFATIKEAFEHSHCSVYDVWVTYYSLGGTATSSEVGDFLLNDGLLATAQQTVLAQSINEIFLDSGQNHSAPYPQT